MSIKSVHKPNVIRSSVRHENSSTQTGRKSRWSFWSVASMAKSVPISPIYHKPSQKAIAISDPPNIRQYMSVVLRHINASLGDVIVANWTPYWLFVLGVGCPWIYYANANTCQALFNYISLIRLHCGVFVYIHLIAHQATTRLTS